LIYLKKLNDQKTLNIKLIKEYMFILEFLKKKCPNSQVIDSIQQNSSYHK